MPDNFRILNYLKNLLRWNSVKRNRKGTVERAATQNRSPLSSHCLNPALFQWVFSNNLSAY